VNERPPSEYPSDYDAHTYDAYSSGSYPTIGTAYADDTTGSYAYIPQQAEPYDQQYAYGTGTAPGYDTGAAHGYDTGAYSTGPYDTGTYTTGGDDSGAYDTGTYDTGAFTTAGYTGYDPYAPGATTNGAGTSYYDTGTYDATAWQTPQQPGYPQQQEWDSGAYPAYGYGYGYDSSGDTGVYEQVPAAGYDTAVAAPVPSESTSTTYTTTSTAPPAAATAPTSMPAPTTAPASAPVYDDTALLGAVDDFDDVFTENAARDDVPVRHDYAVDELPTARSRRRKPAKRSALLTVAVPSVAVMGVAAVGAAALGGVGMASDASSKSSTDEAAGKAPTTQLDRQLSGVSRDADDFATRANRSQERVDLKDRQAAAKKAAEAAAARKEALRPKFVLPVKQKGLSAYFGQSGEHWMALHTGIDFPVQQGTPVMAVTDGTVRTQWNSSYGNMAIVTAPDGTETWYCHLSSTKIRSGKVKAGTVIAYSGNTGNTTGPHLHLEVRPHGGSPVDPLPWLLAHGLDPR
jgi:murein DD-endopeptidase MepM/ murein hydrolase activator NlpD